MIYLALGIIVGSFLPPYTYPKFDEAMRWTGLAILILACRAEIMEAIKKEKG